MILRMKFVLVSVLTALLPLLYAAETVVVPQNSLLFKEENDKRNWEITATAQQEFVGEVIKKEKAFLPKGNGIGICVDVCRLRVPGFDDLCYFPDVVFKKRSDGTFVPFVDRIDSLRFLGIFLLVIALVSAAGYFCWKSDRKKYLLPAAALFFFLGYASWYTGTIAHAVIAPFDEVHYFTVATKLMALDVTSTKFLYTVGFPVVCIPFIALFRLQSWLEFMLLYMDFQTFILIPGTFLVLYWLFHKKLGLSRRQSFAVLILWVILMIFYLPMYATADPASLSAAEDYSGNACFRWIEKDLRFIFVQLTWLGRNAMCDHLAAFLFAVLLAVSMKRSCSLFRFFALSAGFGFLCLVRMNYIFFAPLLAFVFYDSFAGLWQNKCNYLYAFLSGTAGFMIVFVWQLVLNRIQLGSPFVSPYSLHEFSPDRGFVWKVVPYGFKCLCQSNYVYLISGISSLFFIPDRKIRALLTLWIFPMLFFFCGAQWNSPVADSASNALSGTSLSVPIVFNNPVRFIFALYPPLLAALVMNPVWKAARSVRIKTALVVSSSCLLCKSNIFFPFFQPWGLEKTVVSNTVFIIAQAAVCLFCCAVIFSMQKELRTDYANTIRHFRFLLLFTAVFFSGSVCIYIAGILVAAAFFCGLRDTWSAIREIGGRTAPVEPSMPLQ